MSKLGATLKNKRETLGLDIDKVTEDTRISADIIDVLEKGEYKTMPSYNHAKNFVKNYASYLKLDLEKVQSLLDEECTKEDFNREVVYVTAPVTKEKGASPTGMKAIIPILIILVVAFSGYKVYNSMQKGKQLRADNTKKTEIVHEKLQHKEQPVDKKEVKEVIDNINKESAKTEEKSAEKTEAKPEAKVEKKAENTSKEEVKKDEPVMSAFLPEKKQEPMTAEKTAIIKFSDVCWVHIKIDGKEEMDFIAERGNERKINFHDDFVMDIGNAAVVSISYGSRTIAGLGAYKQPLKGLKFYVDDNGRLRYSATK